MQNRITDVQPSSVAPDGSNALVGGSEGYWADIAWTSWFRPFKKPNPIFLPGKCMEDAVNNFYKNNSGGEIIHIYEVS